VYLAALNTYQLTALSRNFGRRSRRFSGNYGSKRFFHDRCGSFRRFTDRFQRTAA
jgi:hypothetical protein